MTEATFVVLAVALALFGYRLCAEASLCDRVIALYEVATVLARFRVLPPAEGFRSRWTE